MGEKQWMDPRCHRAEWGKGEWDGEPDKVQWTDPGTGLVCLAKRHPELGHWCGYVGVEPGHPWHGKGYDVICEDSDTYGPQVHGGLTYSAGCSDGPPESSICHVPEPGTPEHLWWFGFDCGHAGDLSPYMIKYRSKYGLLGEVYRALPYIKEQCTALAAQLAEVKAT